MHGYVANPTTWIDPLGLAACHDSGARGVAAAEKQLIGDGFTIVDREVTMLVNGARVRADIVARKGNKLFVVEVKNGTGRLTEHQAASGVFDLGKPANMADGSVATSKGTKGTMEVATDNRPRVGPRGARKPVSFLTMLFDE